MSIMEKIAERKQHEDKRHDALCAAAAIVQIDPHAREDLITYLKAFNAAQQAGDEDEQEYLVKAIQEIFEIGAPEDGPDLQAWEAEIASSARGREAARELHDETDRFFKAYQRHKARCNISTIRAVAEAAGLSPTTVQAIEKQKVKPQFKTIQALSKAFGVQPDELSGK
ncbi:MAG TPA: helix-turn-helix transcriptional regulator [Humisphaera sp.]|nr:helix-turn-helix transcriptional regulator [Humisphaera sp.]